MPQVDLSLSDNPRLTNSGISGAQATQVGTPPVLEDGDDSTYIEIDGAYTGEGSPAFFSRVDIDVNPQTLTGLNPSNPNFKCYLDMRLSGVQAGLPFPTVEIDFLADETELFPASTPACPDSPAWVTLEMTGSVSGLWTAPHEYAVRVTATNISPNPGSGLPATIRSWRIYEVRLYFEIPTRVTSSCQNFPAETSNGVGGAVTQFPPSRAVALGHGFGGGYL